MGQARQGCCGCGAASPAQRHKRRQGRASSCFMRLAAQVLASTPAVRCPMLLALVLHTICRTQGQPAPGVHARTCASCRPAPSSVAAASITISTGSSCCRPLLVSASKESALGPPLPPLPPEEPSARLEASASAASGFKEVKECCWAPAVMGRPRRRQQLAQRPATLSGRSPLAALDSGRRPLPLGANFSQPRRGGSLLNSRRHSGAASLCRGARRRALWKGYMSLLLG